MKRIDKHTTMNLRPLKCFALSIMLCSLTACEGAFSGVYDDEGDVSTDTEAEIKGSSVTGQLFIDASDWKTWYYLDLPATVEAVRKDAAHNAADDFVALPIPFEPTGEEETERGDHRRDGQYTYYFDVFNEGLTKNHFTSFYPTLPQPEPEKWTIAIHRNNMRTNGLAVYETELTDISLVTEEMCKAVNEWQEDEWSENAVWDDQSTLMTCLVPSQGIKINRVLSSCLTMSLPPIPPAFFMNSHVMLLRMNDGTYGALQLMDYMNSTGKKCCLTIKYRYPI